MASMSLHLCDHPEGRSQLKLLRASMLKPVLVSSLVVILCVLEGCSTGSGEVSDGFLASSADAAEAVDSVIGTSIASSFGRMGKCGVVVSGNDEGNGPAFNSAMLESGRRAGLQWHTHWGLRLQDGFTASDYGPVKLVMQQWGLTVKDIPAPEGPVSKVMLGMNEPDQEGWGGSNTDEAPTLDAWMMLVERARSAGFEEFVAPSIAYNLDWLEGFLDLCMQRDGCPETVDYLGFHLYEPNCPTDEATVRQWNMGTVERVKTVMYKFNDKGMKIKGLWLTEFAGRSQERGGKCSTLEQQQAWMEVFLPMLNAEPAVVAYSWFSYGQGRSPHFFDDANLWDYQTNELNSLGRKYFELCNQ